MKLAAATFFIAWLLVSLPFIVLAIFAFSLFGGLIANDDIHD